MKLLATSVFALAAGCATSPSSTSSPASAGSAGDPSAPAPHLALQTGQGYLMTPVGTVKSFTGDAAAPQQ